MIQRFLNTPIIEVGRMFPSISVYLRNLRIDDELQITSLFLAQKIKNPYSPRQSLPLKFQDTHLFKNLYSFLNLTILSAFPRPVNFYSMPVSLLLPQLLPP